MVEFWESNCPGHKADFKYSLNLKCLFSQILHTDNYMKNKRDFRVFETDLNIIHFCKMNILFFSVTKISADTSEKCFSTVIFSSAS